MSQQRTLQLNVSGVPTKIYHESCIKSINVEKSSLNIGNRYQNHLEGIKVNQECCINKIYVAKPVMLWKMIIFNGIKGLRDVDQDLAVLKSIR